MKTINGLVMALLMSCFISGMAFADDYENIRDNPFCDAKLVQPGTGLVTPTASISFGVHDNGFLRGHEIQVIVTSGGTSRVVRSIHLPSLVTRGRIDAELIPGLNTRLLQLIQQGKNTVEVASSGCYRDGSMMIEVKSAEKTASLECETSLKRTSPASAAGSEATVADGGSRRI